MLSFGIYVQVPHTTFLLTHVCFLFYHMASNMTLRRLRHSIADLPEKIQWFFEAAWILALSYFIAYLETLAISNVRGETFVFSNTVYSILCLSIHTLRFLFPDGLVENPIRIEVLQFPITAFCCYIGFPNAWA